MTREQAFQQATARWGSRAAVADETITTLSGDGATLITSERCYVGVMRPESSSMESKGEGPTWEAAFRIAQQREQPLPKKVNPSQ